MAQDGADGLGDIGRGKHGQRDLVEQRLKCVVIATVDYGDIDWQVREALGRVQAGKARADDDDAGAVSRRGNARVRGCGLILLHCFAHVTLLRWRFGFHASRLTMREGGRRWQQMIAD